MLNKIKLIPKSTWLFSIIFFASQAFLYWLGNILSKIFNVNVYLWKIDIIDNKIPFIPIFIIIYIFSYFFWFINHIIVCKTSKKNLYNYVIVFSLAYLIGFLFFVLFPTYMNRIDEGLILYSNGNGLINKLYRFIYIFDGENTAFNLFPSYHCIASLCCYFGVRKQKEISIKYKIYSLVMINLIFLSVLFTKQHYIIDVIGGILISILCYIVVNKLNISDKIIKKHFKGESKNDKKEK